MYSFSKAITLNGSEESQPQRLTHGMFPFIHRGLVRLPGLVSMSVKLALEVKCCSNIAHSGEVTLGRAS